MNFLVLIFIYEEFFVILLLNVNWKGVFVLRDWVVNIVFEWFMKLVLSSFWGFFQWNFDFELLIIICLFRDGVGILSLCDVMLLGVSMVEVIGFLSWVIGSLFVELVRLSLDMGMVFKEIICLN